MHTPECLRASSILLCGPLPHQLLGVPPLSSPLVSTDLVLHCNTAGPTLCGVFLVHASHDFGINPGVAAGVSQLCAALAGRWRYAEQKWLFADGSCRIDN